MLLFDTDDPMPNANSASRKMNFVILICNMLSKTNEFVVFCILYFGTIINLYNLKTK